MNVAIRLEVSRAGATAHCDDGARRGRLELVATLPDGGAAGSLAVSWRDEADAARSFDFTAGALERAPIPHPPTYAGVGVGRGGDGESELDFLLVAAPVPGRPGKSFVALTLLARTWRSFFVEASAAGGVAQR